MTTKHAVHYSSERPDWETPWAFYERLFDEFRLAMDVCAVAATSKCGPAYFGPDRETAAHRDALALEWHYRCFMNPPYGRTIGLWTSKAAAECESGNAELVVGLLPSRTDTAWWHRDVQRAAEIRLVRGRIKFVGAKHSAPFPSVVVVWRRYHTGPPVLSTMDARL